MRIFFLPALSSRIFVAILVLLQGCVQMHREQLAQGRANPVIVSVAQWGGTPASSEALAKARRHSISHITLHHGGVAFLRDRDPVQYLKNLQAWSRRDKQWLDIPYHYLIDLDGKIYEGRPIEYAGDTNTEYDPLGHALIVVMGNYDEVEPNTAQLDSVVDMMTMLAKKYRLSVDVIAGHKDHSAQTACPGKHLDKYLKDGTFQARVRARL